jgi:hypothetical protein
VLREAVQEQDRRGIRVPVLGDVHPQAGRERDEGMGHPGSSGISVGASGVSVTTPFSYIRSGQFTTRDRRREPRVRHEPPYDAAMASRSGETDNCR